MTDEKKESATRYHKKTMLAAADRLLTEHGYDGMNMNMLSKEAGYSKATVYVYFESKDEIVRALCIERLKVVKSELAVIAKADMSADEKFAEIKGVFNELSSEDKVYFDFICERGVGASTEREIELKSLIDDIIDGLTAIADRQTLAEKWYLYYGRKKTAALFGN